MPLARPTASRSFLSARPLAQVRSAWPEATMSERPTAASHMLGCRFRVEGLRGGWPLQVPTIALNPSCIPTSTSATSLSATLPFQVCILLFSAALPGRNGPRFFCSSSCWYGQSGLCGQSGAA
jgi:hypothetical protein